MRNTTFIYALVDLHDERRDYHVRYIGKADDVAARWRRHCSIEGNPNTHKNRWIRKVQLREIDPFPFPFVIEECEQDVWQERERYWIAWYRRAGHKLTNATVGGDGVIGLSTEGEERRRAGVKAAWMRPGFREKVSAANKAKHEDAEWVAMRRQEQWDTSAWKEMSSKHFKQVWNDPVARERMLTYIRSDEGRRIASEGASRAWQDPKYVERQRELRADPEWMKMCIERMTERVQSPEVREKLKAAWRDPEYRERLSARRAEMWKDPDYREKMSTIRKQGWDNPEERARRVAGLKKAAAQRSPEERSASARRGAAKMTPEKKAERCRKAWITRRVNAAKCAAETATP